MTLWAHFGKNEWFVIIMTIAAYTAFILLPRRLPRNVVILSLVWGFGVSTLFDFTIGGGLLDFYRVNDLNKYELTDLLTYFMFAPFGYFFIYFYEALHIGRRTLVYYVLAWTVVGILLEEAATWAGMTHYQHGYHLFYNVVVYLAVQTATGLYYEHLKKSDVTMRRIREQRAR